MTKADAAKMKMFMENMFRAWARARYPTDEYGRPVDGNGSTTVWAEEIEGGWHPDDIRRAYEDLMNADLVGGVDTPLTYKEQKKALKDKQRLYKQAYKGYMNEESKIERALKNVGIPALSTALKTGGAGYGLWKSGLAAALAQAASLANQNHSPLGSTSKERLGSAAAIEGAKGALGTLLGNAAGGLVDTAAANYKKDAEDAANKAFVDVNDDISGNYWNYAAKTAPRG